MREVISAWGRAVAIAIAVAALISPVAAPAAVARPRAVQLRPLEPRTYIAPALPAAAHDSTVTVSVRGWAEDGGWDDGADRACRWKGVAGSGLAGVVVVAHDDCDRWRPRVTMTWVPRPGERRRTLAVSVQAEYDVSKPSQAPEAAPEPEAEPEPEIRPEWLSCLYDPDGPDGSAEPAPVDVELAPADTLILSRRLRPVTP